MSHCQPESSPSLDWEHGDISWTPGSLGNKGECPWPGRKQWCLRVWDWKVCPFQGGTLGEAKPIRVGVGSGQGCPDVQLNRLWDGVSRVGALPSIRGVLGQDQGWELGRQLKLTPQSQMGHLRTEVSWMGSSNKNQKVDLHHDRQH